MISKSKIALIAALVIGAASPAFAQSFSTGYGTGNELPFAFGQGAAKQSWTVTAPQNEQVAVRQNRETQRTHVAAVPGRGLYDYAPSAAAPRAAGNPDSAALTGGGSTGYNQMVQTY